MERHVSRSARTPALYVSRFSMASLMDSRGAVNVDTVAEVFSMSKAQLADTAGLARGVFQKAAAATAPRRRVWCARCWKSSIWCKAGRVAPRRRWPGIAPSPSRLSAAARPKPWSSRGTPRRFATTSTISPPADTLEIQGRVLPGARPQLVLEPSLGRGRRAQRAPVQLARANTAPTSL